MITIQQIKNEFEAANENMLPLLFENMKQMKERSKENFSFIQKKTGKTVCRKRKTEKNDCL